jgi:hypothetical protein
MMVDYKVGDFVIDQLVDSIRVTFDSQKNWGWFIFSFISFLIYVFILLPIMGLILMGLVGKYIIGIFQNIFLVFLIGLYLYILYKRFLDTLEFIFDKEIVEVNEQSIKIEKTGVLGIRSRKLFLAKNIKGLTTSFSMSGQFNFINRIPFFSSKVGAFIIWHGRLIRPIYYFGKDVSQRDAQNFIDIVYRKFPIYKFSAAT